MSHYLFSKEDGKYQYEHEVSNNKNAEHFHFIATPDFDGIYETDTEIVISAKSKIEAVKKLP